MHLAYLVNQYPSVSHTFIRREICELERQGHAVERFSIRDMRGAVIDSSDVQEAKRTTVLLQGNDCVFSSLRVAITKPFRFLHALTRTLSLWRHCGGILRHLAYLAEACHLLTRLPEGVQHLHAHFGTNAASVALLCRALGGPKFSFTVHGPEEFDRPERLALRAKIAAANSVVAISSFGRSQLYRWSSFGDWPKLHIVRCGLDDDFLAAEPSLPTQLRTLVCVGRLSEQKGQMLLVEAVKRLVDDGVKLRLILVGDGELRGALQSKINSTGLTKYVIITGWQSGLQVRQHIQDARALVLPSFAEGLPVVLMESLALVRPVISTYVAGIPELVIPGENGWLVPAGSVTDLAAAMHQALTLSPYRLQQMGMCGRNRVMECHSATKEIAKLARIFEA